MPDLHPYPFDRLLRRLLRDVEEGRGGFGLPRRAFFPGDPAKDFSVRFHGADVSSPLGPAAGPHTQLAQNIVMAWLGGARVFELKTVQVLDRLRIPRPCIDMRNVGYNIEWSQELGLDESLEEYVKASMLIDVLRAAGLAPGYDRSAFDMSVGYDLRGVRSPSIRAFIDGMKDARPIVERLRRLIPDDLARWRGLDFRTSVSSTVTLSTFHGCPPGEIEEMSDFLLSEPGLNVIVKLNPTLLGPDELRRLLNDEMGYADVRVPEEAFEKDARWDAVSGLIERLHRKALGLGLGFGVKFCNTLVVENRGGFLPASSATSYLSGPPLHALAMRLVGRFRGRFGAGIPVSFSGGIDKMNFPDAVSLGLVPVTVCSDLLKPGGFGRLRGCMEELGKRMDRAGASNIPQFIRKLHGGARRTLERAVLDNTTAYVETAIRDPRYARARNAASPRKVASRLSLFDCLNCEKCISVCPNDANFAYSPAESAIRRVRLVLESGKWRLEESGALSLLRRRQIANFADFCNLCGNCDVFCPEEGGPHLRKPRFFASLESWRGSALDGFVFLRDGDGETAHGRIGGRHYALRVSGACAECAGGGVNLRFPSADLTGSAEGEAVAGADMSPFLLMDFLRKAVLAAPEVNYVNA